MRPRALIAPLGAAALAAVALSGCGATSAIDPVARAAGTTAQTQGAHIAESVSIAVAGQGAIAETGIADFDLAGHNGTMSMTYTGLPAPLGPGPVHTTAVMHSSVGYYRYDSPWFRQRLGNRWIKLDLGRLVSQAYGVDLQQLSSSGADPAQILQSLRRTSSGVTTVGHELLHGIATTHYRGVIALSKFIGSAPASQRAALTRLTSACQMRDIPVDVWVDGRDLVRRVQETAAFTAQGQPVRMDLTLDFLAFGAVPLAPVPGAADVIDATPQLAGQSHC
jgi:hypothetical protein